MIDPVSLAVGTGLSALGGILGKNDQAKNALRSAQARNAVLSDALKRTDKNAADNRVLFDGAVGSIGPEAHSTALTTAQDNRANNNAAALTQGDADGIQLSGSAPGVVRGEIAKRMLSSFQGATERAKASGRLGGYNDAWLGHNLGLTDTGNRVNVNNNFARGQMSLAPSMQDLAEQSVYRAPSIAPQLLSFAGNVLGGAAGRGGFDFNNLFGSAINSGVAGGDYLGTAGAVLPGPGRY